MSNPRRGKRFELIRDKGTNPTGGERQLSEDFSNMAPNLQAELAIHFQVNPANALHLQGTWEGEIPPKNTLQVTLGSQSVSKVVLRIVLIDIEVHPA